ncbi:conserved hypothetical protein [Tenacibaculum xiamenense]
MKITAIVFSVIFFISIANWFFGYIGYNKHKIRRNSWGNKNESEYRKVFMKDLKTISNVKLDSFNIFIEKGYKYGFFSSNQTNLLTEKVKYPYQISHTDRTNNSKTSYSFINPRGRNYDGIDSVGYHKEIYLKEPKIKDTLKMSVRKFRMIKENGKDKAIWDSIGYIKVFEK